MIVKKYFIILAGLLVASNLSGQMRLEVSGNYSNQKFISGDIILDTKYTMDFGVHGVFNIDLSDNITAGIGAGYSRKGYKLSQNYKLRLNYVDISTTVYYIFNNRKIPYPGIGIGYNYGVGANIDGKNVKFKSLDYSKSDLDLRMGINVDPKIAGVASYIGLWYMHGIFDISKASDLEIYNRGYALKFGVYIN